MHRLQRKLTQLTTSLITTRKHRPKTQSLITSPSHYRTPVRTHSQVKHPHSMTQQSTHLLHLRVLPHINLIKRITVSTHDLVHSL